MASLVSGRVRIDVEYDEHVRTHHAYRARVYLDDEVVDSLIVGCPRSFVSNAMSEDSVQSIARAAIHFAIGDRSDLDAHIVRGEGAIVFEHVGPDRLGHAAGEEPKKNRRKHPRASL
jgi:hypothetical protein